LAIRWADRPPQFVQRRIGRNEESAIDVCSVYVAAQNEYAEKGFAGEGVYAMRLVSRPGERDGLSWPAPSGKDEGPLSGFATAAANKDIPSKGGGTHIEFSPDKGRKHRAARPPIW
jgi:hypothetical protein